MLIVENLRTVEKQRQEKEKVSAVPPPWRTTAVSILAF